ncbi:MAG: hypothetical protein COV67_14790 [Nitrospinae bacterium CG11_big_fil_rev_8_21_14_0_20_56_8]|nr:MAG: hypothetical protein COV67_14790 [Nitrospinae bacterium CG11_big_fil_rev_8_21_14_0_20_56_8]
MANVKLKDLKEGMFVSKDVKDRTGRVVVTAGTRMNSKHLKIFKSWGIISVEVEDKSYSGLGAGNEMDGTEGIPEPVIREMSALFKYTDKRHPAIRELFNICLNRKLKTGEGGDSHAT